MVTHVLLKSDTRFVTVRAVFENDTYCYLDCTSLPNSCDIVFPNGAAAEAAGYMPCIDCRPPLCGGAFIIHSAPPSVSTALSLIREGFLHTQSEERLAIRVGVSRSQLSRLMIQHLGASPIQIARFRQTQFARRNHAQWSTSKNLHQTGHSLRSSSMTAIGASGFRGGRSCRLKSHAFGTK